MKTYVYVASTLLLTLVVYGVVIPPLLSAKDDMSVLGGALLGILFPVAVGLIYRIWKEDTQ